MKKILLTLTLIALVTVAAFTYESGAPTNTAGTPFYPNTCSMSSCHTDGNDAYRAGWITSNVPVTGYIPGSTYTITCTASLTGSSHFGFEVGPQNSAGAVQGTLIITDATNTKTVGTGKYVTQKAAGVTGSTNSHSWSFNWTAPSAGTGTVNFYGTFNCANGDGSEAGDSTYKSSLTIYENGTVGMNEVSSDGQVLLSPNPAHGFIQVNLPSFHAYSQLEVFDISGRNLMLQMNISTNYFQIDLSAFANGIYFARFTGESGIITRKFVVN